MKTLKLSLGLLLGLTQTYGQNAVKQAEKINKYEESWESIAHVNAAPDWFQDAKFGIYAHWGPVSAAFEGTNPDTFYAGWHGMKMYEDGVKVPNKNGKPTSNYTHHLEKYGDPAIFGYKHIIEEFKPTAFNAKEWADLFAKSGAKFAGPVAMHHDNFAMWDSKATRWNSMNYGGIDPSAELKKEIEGKGLKFIGSFHHAFTWKYFAPAHQYGGVDPEDYDLYTNPHSLESDTPDAQFYKDWWAKLKEYIDVYQPDVIWFDWWLENMTEESRLKFLAYYYNKGLEWNKEVVVSYKESTFTETVAIKDYERGRPNQPKTSTWLTDTSPGAWFYRPGAEFKTPNELVDILVDIVSKNGLMLLNVPPNPDGSIPQVMKDLLTEMGAWLNVNGDAIYGTRPWTIFGEGPTRLPEGGHKVEKFKIEYKNTDIRFTKKSDKEFYIIVMDTPEKEIVVKSLSTSIGVLNSKIESITLLGSDEQLSWVRNESGLVIQAPKRLPTNYAHAFKVIMEGYKENNIGGDIDTHAEN
ncbi:alpha-L-fucosidase (GH29) [Formosa agariphila KMM 3901]|uniref:alpha-L-fucosidase n=1 Tax=Formosa agariphila (strain DSM 15362 / KCTC 12365 / LMG 23005 / KMM 3901 / M-2Alg 35-1) TaxID=1347342 RepID=T2KPE1_FORAG|nr:alpha-L-fucosidase [Formosa agariphila]CDF79849.1 alpha-L-fucosidase (GH29) [Formosa agariphila KMM 3901]